MNMTSTDLDRPLAGQQVVPCPECGAPATKWQDSHRAIGPRGCRLHSAREDFQHFLAYSNLVDQPADVQELMWQAYRASWWPEMVDTIQIVVDGNPKADAAGFVDIADANGQPLNLGEWQQQDDGMWALKIPLRPLQRTYQPIERRQASDNRNVQ